MNADLLAFADVLLPGDDVFPPASATSIAGLLDRVPAALRSAVAKLATLAPDARIARVGQLEAEQPALFVEAQRTLYLAYYEQYEVVRAIRAMGVDYHAVMLPLGYEIAPFDPETETPRHGRGHWIATDAVRPLAPAATGA
jgi:hypothetical protein